MSKTDLTSPDNPPDEGALYREILTAIVKRFVRLLGAPVALNIARRNLELSVDEEGNVLNYDRADPDAGVRQLVDAYTSVFGEAAVEMSQKAAQPVLDKLADSAVFEGISLPRVRATAVKVLLVDDHVLFREGLVSLLAPQPDLKVVGQAGTAREAIALARKLRPDIILMDFSLPDSDGLTAAQAILAEWPNTQIIVLTVHGDDDTLFAAIRAGAVGFLLKDTRAAELLIRLRAVARGEAGISPAIARRILEEFSRTPEALPSKAIQRTELTAREIEIIHELERGASNQDIARRLVISENTVKNHVRHVLSKLHLRSRREVADYARSHGLTSPHDTSRST